MKDHELDEKEALWENRHNELEYGLFKVWFRKQLNMTSSCFGRNTLRKCHKELWIAWVENSREEDRVQEEWEWANDIPNGG